MIHRLYTPEKCQDPSWSSRRQEIKKKIKTKKCHGREHWTGRVRIYGQISWWGMPSGCFSQQIGCTSKGAGRFFSCLSRNTMGCFQFSLLVWKSPLRSIYSYISLYVSPGKTCATCQDDMSLTFKHLFFFFLVTKTCSFLSFRAFLCKKRENGRAGRMSLKSVDHTSCQMVAAMQSA